MRSVVLRNSVAGSFTYMQVMFDGTIRKKVGDRQIDSFSLFKKGIKPEWEAPENAQGGEWQSRSKMSPQALDLFWVRFRF